MRHVVVEHRARDVTPPLRISLFLASIKPFQRETLEDSLLELPVACQGSIAFEPIFGAPDSAFRYDRLQDVASLSRAAYWRYLHHTRDPPSPATDRQRQFYLLSTMFYLQEAVDRIRRTQRRALPAVVERATNRMLAFISSKDVEVDTRDIEQLGWQEYYESLLRSPDDDAPPIYTALDATIQSAIRMASDTDTEDEKKATFMFDRLRKAIPHIMGMRSASLIRKFYEMHYGTRSASSHIAAVMNALIEDFACSDQMNPLGTFDPIAAFARLSEAWTQAVAAHTESVGVEPPWAKSWPSDLDNSPAATGVMANMEWAEWAREHFIKTIDNPPEAPGGDGATWPMMVIRWQHHCAMQLQYNDSLRADPHKWRQVALLLGITTSLPDHLWAEAWDSGLEILCLDGGLLTKDSPLPRGIASELTMINRCVYPVTALECCTGVVQQIHRLLDVVQYMAKTVLSSRESSEQEASAKRVTPIINALEWVDWELTPDPPMGKLFVAIGAEPHPDDWMEWGAVAMRRLRSSFTKYLEGLWRERNEVHADVTLGPRPTHHLSS